MGPDELDQYFRLVPMPDVRLTLSSGDVVIITESDRPFYCSDDIGAAWRTRWPSHATIPADIAAQYRNGRSSGCSTGLAEAAVALNQGVQMTTEELEKIVHGEPFKPYRLMLTDGEEIVVDRPRKSHVSGDVVSLVGCSMPANKVKSEKFRIVLVDSVVTAEHIDVPVRGR